jgi:hypothetical protein
MDPHLRSALQMAALPAGIPPFGLQGHMGVVRSILPFAQSFAWP